MEFDKVAAHKNIYIEYWIGCSCRQISHDISEENQSGLIASVRHRNGMPLQTIQECVSEDLGDQNEDEQDEPEATNIPRPSSPVEIYYPKNSEKKEPTSSFKIQWKADIKIADFGPFRDHDAAEKSTRRFYWMISIISIFYCIPVYQLIMHYVRV